MEENIEYLFEDCDFNEELTIKIIPLTDLSSLFADSKFFIATLAFTAHFINGVLNRSGSCKQTK